MSDCPLCKDELDDGYCHTCQHDLYDEPEWFLQKASNEIERLQARVEDLVDAISSGSHSQMMDALYNKSGDR